MRIVFTAGLGITGAITRWATWGAAGHVAFELEDGRGRVSYLDATPSLGVAEHATLAGRIVGRYAVMCSDQQALDAVRWASDQIGKPYDWSAIYGMACRRDRHDPRAWFCSELIFEAFEVAGFPLLRAEALDRITPRDLMMSEGLRPV